MWVLEVPTSGGTNVYAPSLGQGLPWMNSTIKVTVGFIKEKPVPARFPLKIGGHLLELHHPGSPLFTGADSERWVQVI
jgi:hypothetical protein